MDLVVTDGEGIDCAFKVEGVVAREPEFNAGVGRKRSPVEGIGFERNALCVCTGYHDEGEAQGAQSLMNLIHTLFFICFVLVSMWLRIFLFRFAVKVLFVLELNCKV